MKVVVTYTIALSVRKRYTKMIKLDLHRVRHEDARGLVINFIEDNWDSAEQVEIITGNSNKMRVVVKNVLYDYDLDYTVGCESGYNYGYMRVQL